MGGVDAGITGDERVAFEGIGRGGGSARIRGRRGLRGFWFVPAGKDGQYEEEQEWCSHILVEIKIVASLHFGEEQRGAGNIVPQSGWREI
jgi:hypothetical protein